MSPKETPGTSLQEIPARWQRHSVPHRGLSVEVSRELSVALDFLFLDGDHSEEAVESDLSAWLPKVKPGGVVAMHDIGWAEGVRKGIERHLKGRTSWETELPNLFRLPPA